VDLPAIGNQAAHILDQVVLTSSLTVATAGSPGDYLVTHSLVGAQFGSSATVAVDLASLALPVLTAYTTANTDDGTLAIDNHGFSLRLGRAARSGFGQSTLAPRVGSPKVGDMVVTLAALARSDDGAVSGCAALDRALCAAVGADAGCLATACPAGLGTLAAKLDAAFDAADGTGLDFYLSGSTPLIDKYNDGTAKQLGAIISPMEIASWSVDLRTAAGRARLSATFEGTRN